jgi:hypothetical protein
VTRVREDQGVGQPTAALPIEGRQRLREIRWEHLFSVYRSGFAFAAMLLCVRRETALACPIPLEFVT